MPAPGRNGASDDLPTTAYLVLGILAAFDKPLTAGEIKTRAEFSVGYFYWSPSVSHVRRELTRLADRDMVSHNETHTGKRTSTLHQATDRGLAALRGWVKTMPVSDQVVIKHPVILKTWLAQEGDSAQVLDALDRHLAATRRRLDEALCSRQRARQAGMGEDPRLRASMAVLNYSIRALYGELSNIAALRDEIALETT
ncbi:MarR family transcriptional regulator [Mycolicibacterium komossense]|uniref:MarR family transcriptional regulator n=1 Tax=Mycolicibacterium komossense TaxID=1779 RepID=A0ABT3CG06_9MYCO|nr:MarR family transcriptional regulator [Mycolicibacterium komossense]MCV7228413.1 MarR family transcriptional regulator [Mycolicibacterium komossense]